MTTNETQTTNYRTITLKNGTVVLAVSEVRALALGPRQARQMVAELAKQGISASVYGKYIKIN